MFTARLLAVQLNPACNRRKKEKLTARAIKKTPATFYWMEFKSVQVPPIEKLAPTLKEIQLVAECRSLCMLTEDVLDDAHWLFVLRHCSSNPQKAAQAVEGGS